MSTNLEYRDREIQEKREVGGRQAKLNEKKRATEKKKQRRHFFVERTTKKFCSSGDKIRNVSGHKCKGENTYDISSIKRVTKKFPEVSRCSRAKQRQINVQKKCAARAKLLFC